MPQILFEHLTSDWFFVVHFSFSSTLKNVPPPLTTAETSVTMNTSQDTIVLWNSKTEKGKNKRTSKLKIVKTILELAYEVKAFLKEA